MSFFVTPGPVQKLQPERKPSTPTKVKKVIPSFPRTATPQFCAVPLNPFSSYGFLFWVCFLSFLARVLDHLSRDAPRGAGGTIAAHVSRIRNVSLFILHPCLLSSYSLSVFSWGRLPVIINLGFGSIIFKYSDFARVIVVGFSY